MHNSTRNVKFECRYLAAFRFFFHANFVSFIFCMDVSLDVHKNITCQHVEIKTSCSGSYQGYYYVVGEIWS